VAVSVNEDLDPKKTAKLADGYLIPAPLVHKVLWGIVISLVTLGGYMALWYMNDKLWKQAVETRITMVELSVGEKILPKAQVQIDQIKARDTRLWEELKDLRDDYEEHEDWGIDRSANIEARISELERKMRQK